MQFREDGFCGRGCAAPLLIERRVVRASLLLLLWFVTCFAQHSSATTWVVVLKSGKRVECAEPFVVINGAYLFRDANGKDQSVPAEDVDEAQTAAANPTSETAGAAPVSTAVGTKSEGIPAGDQRLKIPQKALWPSPRAPLFLLPLGSDAVQDTVGLASYLRDAVGLRAETLPEVDLDKRHWNEQRRQWNAEGLVVQIQAQQVKIGGRPNAVVVGVMTSDMYVPSIDRQFAFAFREFGRFAVISSARLRLPTEEHPIPTEEVRLARLYKVLLKQVGILCYGMRANSDPRSVLYRNVLGVDDLDKMELRY